MHKQLSILLKVLRLNLFIVKVLLVTRSARLLGKTVVFFLGTPQHGNLGDQAITRAENEFIRRNVPRAKFVNVPMPLIMNGIKDILSPIVKVDDVLAGHGGGNMGDTYIVEEECRRTFIRLFPRNKIIIFPQTIHFSDTKVGRQELKKTSELYAQHPDLTLIAREQLSYEKMKQVFSRNKVILTPDIVLSMDMSEPKQHREGLLLCLRGDVEAKLSPKDKQFIADFAARHFDKITNTDTVSEERLVYINPAKVLDRKLKEFRSAELVITDRLHGMVFSTITGTPCIAMANLNHKVAETYKWIRHLPYIKFCKDLSELEKLLAEIELGKIYSYDPAHFNQYWDVIKEAITTRGQ